MIDTKHLCPGCMQNNPTPNKPCPYCGYSSNTPSPEHALPVFSILEGKYLIGCTLGKGGFGISYLAMHLPTETAVAIKEGQILQQLSDINGIVPFREILYCNSTAYIVMAYVPGLSISPTVCHAIEKGLQVDALERYADIKDLMKDLYDGYQESATTEHKTIENIKNDNPTKPTENNTIISNTANIRNDSADAHMPTETASPDRKHPYSFNLTHKIITVCIVFGILLIILSICIAVGLIQIHGTNEIQNHPVDIDSSVNGSTSEPFETDIQNFTSESETAFPDTSFTETTSELMYESDSILANPASKQVSAEKASLYNMPEGSAVLTYMYLKKKCRKRHLSSGI